MSMKKGLSNVIIMGGVLFVLLALVSGMAMAQMINVPMRIDGSINGLPGSSCHVQMYNATGVAADFTSGSSFTQKVYGPGPITFKIDGRNAQVNGGSSIAFQSAGYASITLTYPAVPAATPTANPNSGNNGGSSGSSGSYGTVGGVFNSVTPTPTTSPQATPTMTPTITPTITPTPTPTAEPSPTTNAGGIGGLAVYAIIGILAVLVIAIGAIYFLYLKK